MEKLLILSEKPSAARAMAAALGGKNGTFEGDEYVIVALQGHMMEHGKPHEIAHKEYKDIVGKFSNLSGIPWSSDYFDYTKKKPISKRSAELIKNIGGYLKAGYIPVIACDNDPTGEGDMIAWEILIALNYKGKVYREYHIDEQPDKFLSALREKVEVTLEDPVYLSALARSGMDSLSQQLTRVATMGVINDGYEVPGAIPFGRVQSYILVTLGDQIEAIKNYKPHSEFESRYKLDNLILTSDEVDRFASRDDWSADGLPAYAKVKEIKQVPGSTAPPLPYSLTHLLRVLSQQGLKAKRASALYQKMYDDGYLSYIRTADKTITHSQFNEMLPLLDSILDLLGLPSAAFTHRTARPTHVKDEGHHGALRPGVKLPESLEYLDTTYGEGASIVYKTVAQRFCMMFLENSEWVRHDYVTVDTEPVFKGSLRIITKQGVVDPEENTDDVVLQLPDLSKSAELYVYEIKSRKPAAPTESWLLSQLEKNDVGTSATQSDKLVSMTGSTHEYPIQDGKVLSLSPLGQAGYLLAKNTQIGSVEGTRFIHQLMDEVRKGLKTPKETYDEFNQLLISDMEIIKNTHLNWDDLFKKGKQKEFVEGVWQGRQVRFNRVYGSHRFSDDEVEKLLNGETIEIELEDKSGTLVKASGSLQELEYKGSKYIGFKSTITQPGRIQGVWRGRQISYKGSYKDYTFTEQENQDLLADKEITFTISQDDKDIQISGRLADLEYQGKPYVGFKLTKGNGYVSGVWQGRQISYKGSYKDYVFSDEENQKLQAGETISFIMKKDDDFITIEGALADLEYQGHKYVGFKPSKGDGYVRGTWRGKPVVFKGEFMFHKFTDDEIKKLLDDKKIVFVGISKAGKSMTIGGGLAEQTYQGRKFVGFKAEFDDKTGKGDGLL
mgnify:CR=1 FL=1